MVDTIIHEVGCVSVVSDVEVFVMFVVCVVAMSKDGMRAFASAL